MIHFQGSDDSITLELINILSFCLFVNISSIYFKKGTITPLDLSVCPKPESGLTTSYVVLLFFFFLVQWFKLTDGCNGGIVDHASQFKLSVHV